MSSCSSGCPSQDHSSYGECLRSKGVATTGLESTGPGFSRTTQRAWDHELSEYAAARRQGIQPATTNLRDIRSAVDQSNATGVAFDAAA